MTPYTARDLAQRLHLTPSIITRCLQAYEQAAHLTLPRDALSGRMYQLDSSTFELMAQLISHCQESKTPLVSGVRLATRVITQQRLIGFTAPEGSTTPPPSPRTLDDLTNTELRQVLLDTTNRLWQLTEHLSRPVPRVTPAPVTPAPVQRPD